MNELAEILSKLGDGSLTVVVAYLGWTQLQQQRMLKKIAKRLGIVEKRTVSTPPVGVPIVLPPPRAETNDESAKT